MAVSALYVKSDSFKVRPKKYVYKIGNKANIGLKFCTYSSLMKPEMLSKFYLNPTTYKKVSQLMQCYFLADICHLRQSEVVAEI